MTKEEAIKVLDQVRQWTDYPKEAFTMAIDALSQPSLPSDLDEAAEEYAYKTTWDHGVRFDSFKAGAEWMREQGETQEHFVIGTIADSPCGPAIVCYTNEFEIGDKVVVQIRKKN